MSRNNAKSPCVYLISNNKEKVLCNSSRNKTFYQKLFTANVFFIKSNRGSLDYALMVILLLAIALAIAWPNFRKVGPPAPEKACYANMRVILGAVEMYNMDHAKMMEHLDIRLLNKKGYLRKIPEKPKGCEYYSNDNMSINGHIDCVVHGTVESNEP